MTGFHDFHLSLSGILSARGQTGIRRRGRSGFRVLLAAGAGTVAPVVGPLGALGALGLLGRRGGGVLVAALGVLLGGAALAAADLLLPLFWAEYTRVEALVRALGILAVTGTAAGSFIHRENRRRKAEAEEVEAEDAEEEELEEEEEEKPMTREDILALADTVSRKRR